jgi:hypothetical protein
MLCISESEFGDADNAGVAGGQFPTQAAILLAPDNDVVP